MLVLLSTIGVVLAGEFLGRQYFENKLLGKAVKNWRNNEQALKKCYSLSPNLGFEPIWGKCGYPLTFSVNKTFNPQILGTTNSTTFKILILGDSNTYRATFDRLLKERLAQIYGDQITFEITKVGVESYNTHQEFILLKERLVILEPDLVVIQFTPNDFEFTPAVVRVNDEIYYFSTKGEKNLISHKELFKLSSLYRIYVMNKFLLKEKDLLFVENNNSVWQESIIAMKKTLNEFNTFVRTNQINSIFLIYPTFNTEQWKEPRDTMMKLLDSKNLDYIDLLPYTKKFGGPQYFQSQEEGAGAWIHPTREFDNVVTDELVNYLMRRKDQLDIKYEKNN